MTVAALIVFGGCVLTIGYAYAGYPLWLWLVTRERGEPSLPPAPAPFPGLSIILAVHRGGAAVVERLDNLCTCADTLGGPCEIIVVTDGADDGTPAMVASYPDPRVRLLEKNVRRGKPDSLNRGVAEARFPWLAFADGRQRFAPDALVWLCRHLADPACVAVSGELSIAPSAHGPAAGVDAYWQFERWLRARESRLGACPGVTGAIYALRRDAFRPIPTDTLLDDVLIPVQAAKNGGAVRFEARAKAFDPQPLHPSLERVRKKRTLAGNFQLLWRHPGWFLPGGHPLWFPLLSHKAARLAAGLAWPLLLVANLALLPLGWPAAVAFAAQLALYGLAALGAWPGGPRWRPATLAAGLVFLNLRVWPALLYFASGNYKAGWESPPTKS